MKESLIKKTSLDYFSFEHFRFEEIKDFFLSN